MEQVGTGQKSILTEEIPSGYELAFEPNFYNLEEFLELRSGSKPLSFYICSPSQKLVLGSISFRCDHDFAESGGLAPFGSFDLAEDIEETDLELAIQNLKQTLISKGVNRIHIRHFPTLYSSLSQPRIGQQLGAQGFSICHSQLNHHLETHRSFEIDLHPMEKRKLQSMAALNPIFRSETLDQLPVVYRFIESCRSARGQGMSLQLKELTRMVDKFPNRYWLFVARIDQEIAAATICVGVNPRVMYNFYPAFDEKFQRFSPLVYLIGEILAYCRSQSISILDLGTSEVDGKPNASLSRFKARLGGNTSLKYSFEWTALRA